MFQLRTVEVWSNQQRPEALTTKVQSTEQATKNGSAHSSEKEFDALQFDPIDLFNLVHVFSFTLTYDSMGVDELSLEWQCN